MGGTVHDGGQGVPKEKLRDAIRDGAHAGKDLELEQLHAKRDELPDAVRELSDELQAQKTKTDEDEAAWPILWHSNAPWAATGYGQQTQLFARGAADLGYRTAISAFWGLMGGKLGTQSERGHVVPVYPGGRDPYGNDVLTAHAAAHFGTGDLKAGLIVTLVDVWILNAQQLHESRANVACWTPVDHQPVPPRVLQFLKESGAVPIAMSEFGRDQLEQHELEPLYLPHAIDAQETFTPAIGNDEMMRARQELGLPTDRQVIACVAANKDVPSRKCLPELCEAFSVVVEKARQENRPVPVLYLHTEANGAHNGVNLTQITQQLGLREHVAFVDQYSYFSGVLGPDYVANVYRAADVTVNPAKGEGFGIPIVEAQACGSPVIVGGNTAQVELSAEPSYRVKGVPEYTYQGSWQFRAIVPELAKTIENALKHARGQKRERYRERARALAQTYDYRRVVADHFEPLLAELHERFTKRAEPKAEIWTPGPEWDPRKGGA